MSEKPSQSAHFALLDGLRGAVALVVVWFHQLPELGWRVFGHGYLAVDFFFALSGFVIAHAYERKLLSGTLSFGRYAILRAIRLYPLLVVGAIIGLVAYAGPQVIRDGSASLPWGAAAAFPLNAFAIPAPPRLLPVSFGLNQPTWSIFQELVLNAAYALFLVRLRTRTLVAIMTVVAAVLCSIAYRHAGISVGWWWSGLGQGVVRAAYPFLAGVCIERAKRRGVLRIPSAPPLAILVVLLLVLAVPILPEFWNALFDVLAALVLLPAIVAVGSFSRVASPGRRLCNLAGELSYPVYILHSPMFALFAEYALLPGGPAAERTMVGTLVVLIVSLVLSRLYDRPVRAWLQQRLRALPDPRHGLPAFAPSRTAP